MGELFDESVVLSNDTGPSASSGLEAMAKNQRAIKELEGAQAPQSKTITSGSISPTAAYVIVDTEGSAAADDLSVISPVLSASENLHDGMVVYLKAADSGRVVTVKNTSSANGINTYDGNDYVLSTTHWLKLQLRADGKWYEVEGRGMVAALAAATAANTAQTTANSASANASSALTSVNSIPPIGGSVAITGATALTTSAFGKLHICTGTSADYTVTLPAVASSAGKMIQFVMSRALTKLITIKGSGAEIIDGSNTRIMWAGESATLYCDGTSWYKIAGTTIPMKATKYRATTQSVSAETSTLVVCNTTYVSQCPAAMLAGSGVITVLRPGAYDLSVNASSYGWTSTTTVSLWAAKNGSSIYADRDYSPNPYLRIGGCGGGVAAVAGDLLGLYVASSVAMTIDGGTSSSVSVTEVPNW